jgi:Aerotolerance regulator N-terminal/von Willebrand factor type A domain/CARDB
MSFLSAIFLFALPLVAVPVVIHLYRGRRRDTIAWGAMQFLAQATTKGRSMERLEELLLMLLRVGTVLALVLALAQPMIRSSLFGDVGNREVVLILDNSLSMAREVDGVAAVDKMKEQALEVLDELGGGDRVQLMLAAGGAQWLTAEGVAADAAGQEQLASLIENVRPTLGSADLLACLQSAVYLEPTDNPSSRRIVVFTDDQARSWQLDAMAAWNQLGEARDEAKVPSSIEIVECSFADADQHNLAVMKIEASQLHARPGESVGFTAQITNVGHTPSEPAVVQWLVDDEAVETSDLAALGAKDSSHVSATLALKDPGNYAISCRIDATDQNPLDQEETVVVEVSDQIPILIVHDAETDLAEHTADELLTIALGYRRGEPLPWHSVYAPEVISSSALATAALSNYRAVVITNLGELEPAVRERLQEFVQSGGGLWVALGDRIDRRNFNRDWYDDGDGPSPLALETLRTGGQPDDPAHMIHPPKREHPATAELANTTQLDIEEARVYEYWQLGQGDVNRRDVSVILESGDGSPLVTENYVGQGRVLVQAFPIGLEQSNLPQLKSFLVMVQDWLGYLTAPSTARHNLAPGSAIVATLPPEAAFAKATLETPTGAVVPLFVQEIEGAAVARYAQTQMPGLYRAKFTAGGESVASVPFYVIRDSNESQLEPLSATDRADLTSAAGLRFDGGESTDAPIVDSAPRQEPVWGLLLGALVALLGGELLLSHWLARQRSAVAVSAT